jgi:hypothetical protein
MCDEYEPTLRTTVTIMARREDTHQCNHYVNNASAQVSTSKNVRIKPLIFELSNTSLVPSCTASTLKTIQTFPNTGFKTNFIGDTKCGYC